MHVDYLSRLSSKKTLCVTMGVLKPLQRYRWQAYDRECASFAESHLLCHFS